MTRIFFNRAVLIAFAFAIFVVPYNSVHAQSDEVKSARDKVTESADKLTKLKAEAVAPLDELSVKKTALKGVLDLSLAEAKNLYDQVSMFEEHESELVILQQELLDNLQSFTAHLVAEKTRFEGVTDIDGIKLFAQTLNNWRTNVYNPEVTKAIEFRLVMRTQEVLKTTDERFIRLSQLVKRTKSIQGKTGEGETLLNQAARNIKDARIAYGEARQALIGYVPVVESNAIGLIVPSISKGEIAKPIALPEKRRISDLVGDAFMSLKGAYDSFLKLARLIVAAQ